MIHRKNEYSVPTSNMIETGIAIKIIQRKYRYTLETNSHWFHQLARIISGPVGFTNPSGEKNLQTSLKLS